MAIEISGSAKFEHHISELVAKANRQSSWILRTFSSRQPDLMLVLFKQLVLPILEYCCQVWSPSTLGEIRSVESIQRFFTSKIDCLNSEFYWSRLKKLALYSLERRRERYIILYIFKIMKGIVPNLTGENLRITFNDSGRRGLLCHVPILNRSAMARYKTLKDNSLAVRGPRLFNCLPTNIRDVNLSLSSFKRRLDKFLASIPDQPSLPGAQYAQTSKSNTIEDQLEDMRRKGIFV